MPTNLPPDYKPKGPDDSADPALPGIRPEPGSDVVDDNGQTGPLPGTDVVDPPPGWHVPAPIPPREPTNVPQPAGTPTF